MVKTKIETKEKVQKSKLSLHQGNIEIITLNHSKLLLSVTKKYEDTIWFL